MVLFVLAFGRCPHHFEPMHLPILPFTFARQDQPFRRSGLPLWLSMAVTLQQSFACRRGRLLAVRANQYGRHRDLIVFEILGLSIWHAC